MQRCRHTQNGLMEELDVVTRTCHDFHHLHGIVTTGVIHHNEFKFYSRLANSEFKCVANVKFEIKNRYNNLYKRWRAQINGHRERGEPHFPLVPKKAVDQSKLCPHTTPIL
jgi:hypothetical protein